MSKNQNRVRRIRHRRLFVEGLEPRAMLAGNVTALFVSVGKIEVGLPLDCVRNVLHQTATQPIPLVGGGSVFILLSQLNTCTGESFDGVGGNQGVIDVALNHRLSEGTVRGTATIYEVGSGGSVISSFDVSVDLTWTGVGSQIRVNGDSEYRSGGFIVNTLNHADVRLATAVGTISDGTTNFTPTSSTNALIEWNTFHQVTVQCVSLRCQ